MFLEHTSSIAYLTNYISIEKYYLIFKIVISGIQNCFPFVDFFYSHLVINTSLIELRKYFDSI